MKGILGEPIEEYHAHDAISATKLDVFHASPLDFYELFCAKSRKRESTAGHFVFGSAVHLMMEGGLPFYEKIVVNEKYDSWRTNEAKAWKAEQEKKGLLVMDPVDVKGVEIIGARIKANKTIMDLMDGTDAEVTYRKSFGKFAVQCRFDRIREDRDGRPIALDWKSCASLEQFEKNVWNLGYHRSCCFYQEVLAACLSHPEDAPRARFVHVAMESAPPYEVQAYEIDADSLAVARAEIMMDLRLLKICYDTGNWNRPETIKPLTLPGYAVNQAKNRLLANQQRLQLAAPNETSPT